jgi:hypothetical protein
MGPKFWHLCKIHQFNATHDFAGFLKTQ